jgi:hypothetical protein
MATKKSTTAKKSTSKAKTSTTRSRKPRITENKVRERAYALYLEREQSGIEGSPENDWYLAENDLKGTV